MYRADMARGYTSQRHSHWPESEKTLFLIECAQLATICGIERLTVSHSQN
jgi:hypothetical protein